MQNKRFLGLGFTFAAKDQGLEKKLVRIASLFDRINKSAKNISVGGIPGANNVGGGHSGSQASRAYRVRRAVHRNSESKQTSSDSHKSANEPEHKFDTLKTIADQYSKVLGGSVGKVYASEAQRIIKKGQVEGKSFDYIFSRLKGNAENSATSANKLDKQFTELKKFFGIISAWIGNVRHSVEHLFNVFGIQVSDILPKEIQAVFGVLKSSILSPLAAGFKMAGTKILGAATGGINEKNNTVLGNKVDVVSKTIGDKKSIPTPQVLLRDIRDNLKKSGNSESEFSLTDLGLGGLLLAAGLLSDSFGMLARIMAPFAKEGIFFRIGKMFRFVGESLGKFFDYLKDGTKFGEWLKSIGKTVSESKLGKFIGEIAEFFDSIVGGVFGKFKGAIEWISEAFTALSKAISESTFVKWIGDFGTMIGKVLEPLSKFGEFIGKLLEGTKFLGFLKAFGEGFAKFVPFLGEILILIDTIRGIWKAAEDATGVFDFFRKAFLNIINNILVGIPEWLVNKAGGSGTWDKAYGATRQNAPAAQPLADAAATDAMQKYKQSLADNAQVNQNTAALKESADKTNDLLSQISNQLGDTGGKSKMDINIKTDSKAFSATVGREEKLNFIQNGVGVGI